METQYFNGWKNFSRFFSAENTQSYLKKKYISNKLASPEQKGFENCYTFLYYLEHGQIYYQQAEKSPLILKPILLFYGLVHLIKACILTIDPLYPENTSVLAHGVTARKRKKQNYLFFQDEVKFQRNGLFPFMSEKMFHMKHLEGDKKTMEELFRQIPELNHLFFQLEGKRTVTTLQQDENGQLFIPEKILDNYHMTENRFKEFLLSQFPELISISNDKLAFTLKNSPFKKPAPVKYDLEKHFFTLSLYKDSDFHFPELLIHYLLLYNLSMIARYETEWWGELTKMMPTKDYPFIESFLNVTQKKGPFLIYHFLME